MKKFLTAFTIIIAFLILCGMSYGQITNKFALIIGITGYEHYPNGEKLEYADEDANSFDEFLKTKEAGSFPSDNIILLKNEKAIHDM